MAGKFHVLTTPAFVLGLADLPVIFISTYGGDEPVARALDAGAADYIVKPFSPTELTARVRAALRRRTEPDPFLLRRACGRRDRGSGDPKLVRAVVKRLRRKLGDAAPVRPTSSTSAGSATGCRQRATCEGAPLQSRRAGARRFGRVTEERRCARAVGPAGLAIPIKWWSLGLAICGLLTDAN